jgi:hypothetical protein
VAEPILKQDLIAQIAYEVGVCAPRMSTGSTEPREIFDVVDHAFGLRIAEDFRRAFGGSPTKTDMARLIVASAGLLWTPTCESRGGTVTREGLLQVLRAVRFFRSGRTAGANSEVVRINH